MHTYYHDHYIDIFKKYFPSFLFSPNHFLTKKKTIYVVDKKLKKTFIVFILKYDRPSIITKFSNINIKETRKKLANCHCLMTINFW